MIGIYAASGLSEVAPPLPTDAWDEVARQATIASGKLTISGLSLGDYIALHILWTGVRVTTDDSELYMRFRSGGAEQSTLYRGTVYASPESGVPASAGYGTPASTDKLILSRQTATAKIGNAAGEAASGEMIVYEPASLSLFKLGGWEGSYIIPSGASQRVMGGVSWEGTTAIDGMVLYGSSDLVDGELIVLGLK